MSQRGIVGLVAALFLAMLALDSYFIVNERERAVLKRFQEIVRSDIRAGIHFKMPFIDQVLRVDGRAMAYEIPTQSYLTSERKLMDVSSFVIWRVEDVHRYVTVIGGTGAATDARMREVAQQRINARISERLRNAVAQRTVQEVVAGRKEILRDAGELDPVTENWLAEELGIEVGEDGEQIATVEMGEVDSLPPEEDSREQLMVAVLEDVQDEMLREFGIAMIEVRLKQVDWPDAVRERVFDRMRAERARDAAEHRAEGREAAEGIRAAADRRRTILLAEAFEEAEILRGEGDATAAATYAQAFGADREFFNFYRSINAYRETFRGPGDVMVLEPDSDFFRYMKSSTGSR